MVFTHLRCRWRLRRVKTISFVSFLKFGETQAPRAVRSSLPDSLAKQKDDSTFVESSSSY
jgi:hypothetical protein